MSVCVRMCVMWVCDRKQHFGGALGLKSRFVPVIEFFSHRGVEFEREISSQRDPGGFREEMIPAAAADVMITLHH